jgi:hypothetical protein
VLQAGKSQQVAIKDANKLQLKILCQQKYCKNHAKRSVQQGGAPKNPMVYNGLSSFRTKIAQKLGGEMPQCPIFLT